MINWRQFEFNESPSYSDKVYPITSSNVKNHVPRFDHKTSLLGASPMHAADDRRFAIAQLTKTARETHLASFPRRHVQDIQRAVDTLVDYIDHHEEKSLSSYDAKGRPQGYDQDDDDDSVASSQTETCCEDWHDSEVLTGLSLDLTVEHFGLELLFSEGHNSDFELGSSPTSSKATTSPPRSLEAETLELTSPSPFEAQHPLPILPTPQLAPSVMTPLPPSLVAATSSTRNTHPTLSIANLINPAYISPEPSNHPDDLDVNKVISITDLAQQGISIPSRVNIPELYEEPEAAGILSPTTRQKEASFNQLNAIRQGLMPIPLRSNRQWKLRRMRRSSRSRENAGKNGSSSRIEPGRNRTNTGYQERYTSVDGQDKKTSVRDEYHHQSTHQSGSDPDQRHSSGHTARTDFYGSSRHEFNPIQHHLNHDIEPDIETSSGASYRDYKGGHTEELDKYTAHQLPTNAIRYHPLDIPIAIASSTLKRKTRDDDDHLNQRQWKRPTPNSWTLSGWQP